jgi:hypothetical protein
VVVAVGLTLVDPLADVEVKLPGVIATLTAPVVVQLSLLLAPELIVAGFAVKELIVGTAPFPGDEPDELDEPDEPQPANPAQANRARNSAQRFSPDKRSRRELDVFPPSASVESMCAPSAATCLNVAAGLTILEPLRMVRSVNRYI